MIVPRRAAPIRSYVVGIVNGGSLRRPATTEFLPDTLVMFVDLGSVIGALIVNAYGYPRGFPIEHAHAARLVYRVDKRSEFICLTLNGNVVIK